VTWYVTGMSSGRPVMSAPQLVLAELSGFMPVLPEPPSHCQDTDAL
jgi:hypothetical protein